MPNLFNRRTRREQPGASKVMSDTNKMRCPCYCKPIAEATFFSLAEEFCEEAENAARLLARLDGESAFSPLGARDLGFVRGGLLAMAGKLHTMRMLSSVIAEAAKSKTVETALSEVLEQNQRLLSELTEQELSVTIAFQSQLDGVSLYPGSDGMEEELRMLHEVISSGSHVQKQEQAAPERQSSGSDGKSIHVLIRTGPDIPDKVALDITARIAPLVAKVIEDTYRTT